MQLYFTDRDSPITKDVSNWAMDDEIYYDMDILPEARILAAAYTPKPLGRNAGCQKRAEELTGGGKRVSIYDVQPQMWTYERTVDGGRTPYRAFVSIPGHLYENFNRPNYRAILLRGIAWAGKRAERRRAPDEGRARRRPALRRRRTDRSSQGRREDRSAPGVRPDARRGRAADPQGHEHRLGRARPAVGLGNARVSQRPQACRTPRRGKTADRSRRQQERDPEDTISILSDTNGDGVMDRKHVFADKLELVTGFVFYRNGVIAATSPDIWYLEDTNGDEVADKRTRLYTGLGTADTHAVINNLRWGLDGWIYATHGYSVGTVTSPGRREELRPRWQRRRALQA